MKSLSKKVANAEASQTLALTAIAKQMKAEGIDVVSLTAGEPDFPTPAHIKRAAIQAIDENFTKYTVNAGIIELRSAIADKLRRDNQVFVEPSQILVSNGAKHSIFNALQAICNRNDEVIIPAPYWVSYPEAVKLVDGVPVILKTTEKTEFKISAVQLQRAITKKTKALILCSPSNPTGSVYTQAELEAIGEVVRKTGIYVIADEIYEKVIYDNARHFSLGSISTIKDLVITINGVSKAYSMTGWRIGYLAAAKPIVEAAEKVQSQVTSAPSSISQRAAAAAISGPEDEVHAMTAEFKSRRDYVHKELVSMPGISCPMPHGAFYLFPNVSGLAGGSYNGKKIKTGDDVTQYLLEECRVVTVPGSGFGAKNNIRLSYACSMDDLRKAVERMKQGFQQLK
ncbi:MAG TPA: pyridoxal phosphate-dependent aminotransferase [Bacteroidota bacterium]|nr:pyridoxal phosphate-dependent aminotransferase [Bacteroidota bacterium]